MTKEQLIDALNQDLRNEYTHMHFYLHSCVIIRGLHREELREFLLEEAKSELEHVQQFADLIVGLGGHPEHFPNEFPTTLTDPKEILLYALNLEEQVTHNYFERIKEAEGLDSVDGRWVVVFLESQLEQSRKDIDHIRQLLS